jgi:predicted thioesterase
LTLARAQGSAMNSSENAAAATPELSAVTRVTVETKDTVGAMVPGMPMVAATPYLVGVAEMACSRLLKDQLEPGQITVGRTCHQSQDREGSV